LDSWRFFNFGAYALIRGALEHKLGGFAFLVVAIFFVALIFFAGVVPFSGDVSPSRLRFFGDVQ
tara:strand:+ start:298 stop:489 length:192 start_codon:yes stop_codon:yes gene_type:complete